MVVGIIGLGAMGSAIAHRLCAAGHEVFGYDVKSVSVAGVRMCTSISQLTHCTQMIWIMVPADVVDMVLASLAHLGSGALVIDGGNSHFNDSVRRAQELAEKHIAFLDCGISGGLAGKERGFSVMVGGTVQAYERAVPIFQAIAAPNSYALVGPSGAGHYVKMIHNGIEYGMLQAYAEGLQLLHQGRYAIDLEQVTAVWQHASIIRSYMLDLSHDIFASGQSVDAVSGMVEQTGMGKWTVAEAHVRKIPVPVIEQAVKVRDASRRSETYATKLISLLRHAFGGHKVNHSK